MNYKNKTLVVIPARSGSKGIPRKNLKLLGGKPLIAYAIQAAQDSKKANRVIVSTDCEEIAYNAKLFGADVIKRHKDLSKDAVTLDPVIKDVIEKLKLKKENYDLVITFQATCPFITGRDIDGVIDMFGNSRINSVVSVTEDKHLRWKKSGEKIVKDYEKRVNRQKLPDTYKETGGLIAVRVSKFKQTRIVKPVEIYKLDEQSGLDIDTPKDLLFAEALLARKKIALWPIGVNEKGMGHIYRTMLIADFLTLHELKFVMEDEGQEGIKLIKSYHYPLKHLPNKNQIVQYLKQNKFEVVIIDSLDTRKEIICELKIAGIKVITFEDLGSGSNFSDLTINALYNKENKANKENHIKFGSKYFLLRPEFQQLKNNSISKLDKNSITLIFGGSDPNNLTLKSIKECHHLKDKFKINIILGPAYKFTESLTKFIDEIDPSKKILIVKDTKKISDFINSSLIVLCSGGQTLYESIALNTPCIVISQNKRELTHGLLAEGFGGLKNLGLHSKLRKGQIKKMLEDLINDRKTLKSMQKQIKKLDLISGNKRVITLLNQIISQ